MKALFFVGAALVAPLGAQVSAPSTPVTVPSTPVTVPANPAAVPGGVRNPANPASQPQTLINPAIPTAAPLEAVGRTFQTTPTINPSTDPSTVAAPLGFPPVVGGGGAVTVTNTGIGGTFSTNVGGFAGTRFGTGIAAPVGETAPPIVNPASEPVAVDLPPGSVVRTAPGVGVVGGLTPATPVQIPRGPVTRFPGAVGSAPGVNQGTGTSPAPVVRPQR